jgi:hypothetical protein
LREAYQFVAKPHQRNRLNFEEGVRNGGSFGLISKGKPSTGFAMTATRRLTAILAADMARLGFRVD